jgi:DNA-binding MarR family transcriptional regulator
MGKPLDGETKGRAWALLLAAHAVLVERMEAALAEAGLPPLGWYDVLWELEKAAGGKLRMHELAGRVVLSRSNLTRLADRLEEEKLIIREAAREDRRGAYCVLTQAGIAMRRKMWPVYRQAIEAHFSGHLNEREAETLSTCFERLVRAQHDTAERDARTLVQARQRGN